MFGAHPLIAGNYFPWVMKPPVTQRRHNVIPRTVLFRRLFFPSSSINFKWKVEIHYSLDGFEMSDLDGFEMFRSVFVDFVSH